VIRAVKPILDHKVPYELWKTGWWYVLGSAVLVAFHCGLSPVSPSPLLMFRRPVSAYNSLKFITEDMTFGGFLRGMHFGRAARR